MRRSIRPPGAELRPQPAGQGLKDKKSNLVGFITPNLSSPYYMSVIKMCEEQLKTQGYHMLVLSLDLQETDDTSPSACCVTALWAA